MACVPASGNDAPDDDQANHPRKKAVQDVEQPIDYYLEEGATQAASDLIDALQAAYRLIALHPGIGSPRYGCELDIPGLRGRALG